MVRTDHKAKRGGNAEQADAQRLAFRRPFQSREMQVPEEIGEGRVGRTDELPVDRKGVEGVEGQEQIRDGLKKTPGDQHKEPCRDDDEPAPDRRGLPSSEKSDDKQQMQKYANRLHHKVGDPVTVHKLDPFCLVFTVLSGISSTMSSVSQSEVRHIFPGVPAAAVSYLRVPVIVQRLIRKPVSGHAFRLNQASKSAYPTVIGILSYRSTVQYSYYITIYTKNQALKYTYFSFMRPFQFGAVQQVCVY